MMRAVVIMTMVLLVSACTSPFRADVTRFHSDPVALGQAILIEPEIREMHGLEFTRYAELVGAKLAETGYRPAGEDVPDLIARINYGITSLGEKEDRGGASIGIGVGRHGRNTGIGLGTVFDLSGEDDTIYERFLTLTLNNARTGERIFEGRVISQGKNNDLASIMPLLVEALFDNYPGQSGKTETITIKIIQ